MFGDKPAPSRDYILLPVMPAVLLLEFVPGFNSDGFFKPPPIPLPIPPPIPLPIPPPIPLPIPAPLPELVRF